MPLCPSCDFDNQGDSNYCAKCGFETYSATGRISPDTLLEGRYLIVETIGRGGMGAVYKALDMRLENTPVAVKEMSTNALGPGKLAEAVEAFKKEASMLIKLRHPALPRITDYFSNGDDRWYIVMDYIEGETLEAIAQKRGPIPEAELIDWAKQICGVLDYLHNQAPPVIFRDLKPANIMLTSNNEIKLIDFGIARHFKPGTTSDTSHYASLGFSPPEQYGEGQTDSRSDIYSLGATMHYLLTGIDPSKKPFHFTAPIEYGYGSDALNNLIQNTLELNIEERPASANVLLKHLKQLYDPSSKEFGVAGKTKSRTVAIGKQTNSRTMVLGSSTASTAKNEKKHLLKLIPVLIYIAVFLAAIAGVHNFVPVSAIELNYEVLQLELGEEGDFLLATIKPIFIKTQPLLWESSDPDIVAVDEHGYIGIADVGTATITVSTSGGSKHASCEIEVVYPTTEWNDGVYSGRLKDDKPNGFGEWLHPSGESYSGYWEVGSFSGEGTHVLPDAQVFIGEYVAGLLQGEGSWSNADGDTYIGEFLDSKKHGEGIYTWSDGAEYTGEFLEGLKHGGGVLIASDGMKTEGEWKDDEYVIKRASTSSISKSPPSSGV